jgi:hypothetical protein
LFLAFPAAMALAYPLRHQRASLSLPQRSAVALFLFAYTLFALLRYEVGSDWYAYEDMYQRAQASDIAESLAITDPGFGLLLWLSGLFGLGVYPVNAMCAFVLGYGIVRVAALTREPWLAIAGGVPYLLIVVGFGYVRQSAAIGLILVAVAALDRERPLRTMLLLGVALLFHSTSIAVWPVFAMALANRNRLRMLAFTTLGAAAFIVVLSSRIDEFQQGYLESEYSSGGAFVRLLMGLIPSLLLLLRWRAFDETGRVRLLWLGFALANIAGFFALGLSPSTTAVDRIALYFAAVQLVVFGEISRLLGTSARTGLLLRLLVLGLVAAIQIVWLVYATHAEDWVPYETVLRYF